MTIDLLLDLVSYGLTGALVLVAVLLAYPVVAYSQNVQHTEGLVFLSLGFVWLAVANAVGFVHELTAAAAFVPTIERLPYGWGQFFSLLSAVFATVGLYFFARPFIDVGDEDYEFVEGAVAEGGFESADGEGSSESPGGGFENAHDGGVESRPDGGDEDAAE